MAQIRAERVRQLLRAIRERWSNRAKGFDVPFGVQEEDERLKRPIIVGLIAVVAILLCIGIVANLTPIIASSLPSAEAGSTVGNSALVVTQANDNATENSSSDTDLIYVHVIGCVENPGVYGVPKGSRLIEAIQAAGGLTADAVSDLNLARELTDGEQVHVYSQAEAQELGASASESIANGSAAVAGSQATTGEASSQAGQSTAAQASAIDASGRVNVNVANSEQLQTVSGIGPAVAAKIIAEREANGPFSSLDDLTRVSGIGEKKLAALRDYLTV